MQDTVFIFDKSNQIIVNPEARRLVPLLSRLKVNALSYIVLSYDYTINNPYHTWPEQERMVYAQQLFFPNKTTEEINKNLEKEIDEYLSLIYEPRRVTNEIYKKKLHQLQRQLDETDDPTVIKTLDSAMTLMSDKMEANLEKIKSSEETIRLKGQNKQLSWIELWKRRKKEYYNVKTIHAPNKGQGL